MSDCMPDRPADAQDAGRADHDDRAAGVTDAADDHPAGSITLPGRLRAETRILALTGVASVAASMALLTGGCRFVLSVSSDI